MTLHHVTCHVTEVMYLVIVQEKKRNIKLRKIDKKKKILVFKHTMTLVLWKTHVL